ncbi:lipocalin family protein [Aquimarina gracilis]|uniref:Lipocalin family protein n=1 Tax=Aquimarina gracilis TaxID=874422 RepID=A0ABU5ZQF1_9FLAO|nr:lipocalin family protein [Aquimarina gracilis]MEB3344277.1 lipocalin family protein [Aquimarina gracilis]
MKKLSVFILLIAATFTSCSSDDDAPGISEANLIGTWQWTAAAENGTPETLDECDLQDTYEFRTDGTLVSIFYNSTVTNGQTICNGPNTDEFKWSLSGETLTFTFDGGTVTETETATITTLNGDTLMIEYRDEETPGEITVYTETYRKL